MQKQAVGLAALVFVVVASVVAITAAAPGAPIPVALAFVAAAGVASLVYALASSRHRAAPVEDDGGEPQCRRIVEQVEQVVFELDAGGRWRFVNPAWHALTGYDAAATLGEPFVARLHPDDRLDVGKLCAALLAGEREACRVEVRVVTRLGTVCWADVRGRAVVHDGVVVGVVGTMADITASRQVQQELERARLAAEQANTAKSEFLKSMSHEMRTPLNGVIGLLELLTATPLDGQQSRYVSVARASASHLATLIADVLDMARIDAGGLALERSLFDLPDLVEGSLEAVAADARRKRLRLSCTIARDVPTWVIGDPGRLRQVLVNLLVNAVKFTDEGDVHLQADAQVDLQTRRATVRLEVHDTGIGIPAEQIERLFLPFTPGDASSTRRYGGTGLGLTICKHLVDAMQGTITVRSVERAGATFVITMPLDVADAAMVEAARESDASPRVLAVLADPADREAIGPLLEGWRFDAAVVEGCDDAWRHVQAASPTRRRFTVVLLDGQAPGAAALSRRLRALRPEPGIVWVTPEDGELPAEIAGVRWRIARPVGAAALFDALMQAVVGASGPAGESTGTHEWPRVPRVLVAEDDDINQMVVRELLEGMGCAVDVVGNGEDAVAAVLARRYDVVLMDCRMPVLDGLEATRRLRRAYQEGRTRHAPCIVALTANATTDDRQACLAAGMDAYLTKPVRSAVLLRTLQRLLAGAATAEGAPVPSGPDQQEALPSSSEIGTRADAPDAEDILDPAEVLLRCNHNGDLGARMLQLFAESLPAELEALHAAAAANDREAIARIAHKLRGAAATLAAARLAGAISGVELFLRYGDGGPLADLLAAVRHESALFLGVVPQTARRLLSDVPAPRP